MIRPFQTLSAALSVVCIMGSVSQIRAADESPIVTLTPAQEKSLAETYFNCDHEGEVGCLEIACRHPKLDRQSALDVQYLYRDVAKDFPDMVTPKLRACFIRAGGRFR